MWAVAWGRAKLTPQADVWALGATLFAMLTGAPPFGVGGGTVIGACDRLDQCGAVGGETEQQQDDQGQKAHEALVAAALALN